MPSGKTHDKITIIITPILLIILSLFAIPTNEIIIITISFLFAGFMFNGDLDLYSSPYKRWLLLRFIWRPYQNMFSHRSIFTHGLIIGTIIRLLYIGVIPLIILYYNDVNLSFIYSQAALLVYFGLELGSASHTIADKTVSFFLIN